MFACRYISVFPLPLPHTGALDLPASMWGWPLGSFVYPRWCRIFRRVSGCGDLHNVVLYGRIMATGYALLYA